MVVDNQAYEIEREKMGSALEGLLPYDKKIFGKTPFNTLFVALLQPSLYSYQKDCRFWCLSL